MSAAQTIYFIGLIVLLCGVGIVYANAKPIENNQKIKKEPQFTNWLFAYFYWSCNSFMELFTENDSLVDEPFLLQVINKTDNTVIGEIEITVIDMVQEVCYE